MANLVKPVVESVNSLRNILRTDLPADEILDEEMSILDHLEELRRRVVKMALAIVATTVFSLIFTPQIFVFLKAPAPPGTQLIFIEVTEMFLTYFNVALMTGAGLAMPIFLWQIIGYIAPGLTRGEKRLLLMMLPLLTLFFFFGALFGYYVTLPFALSYLLNLFPEIAQAQIRLGDYIGFVTTILFWMGLVFELPVIIYVLSKVGVVTPTKLASIRKYAILAAFVIAAIITPTPDPLNQCLVAVPLIVLYEVGILMARIG